MIRIVSGYSGPGGSTIVFNTLTNLFNSFGVETCFYGPTKWEGITCNFKSVNEFTLFRDDYFIFHYLNIVATYPCKKQILSCHETELFSLRNLDRNNSIKRDNTHFVSEFQKKWHGVRGVVIPNPVRKFEKKTGKTKSAAIIGSIDPNKRTDLSIVKALNDGHTDIQIVGHIGNNDYYLTKIKPLLSDNVRHIGCLPDISEVYNRVTHVYHSPILETFNLIKAECLSAGIEYIGEEGNDTKAEYWSDERIFKEWMKLLSY